MIFSSQRIHSLTYLYDNLDARTKEVVRQP